MKFALANWSINRQNDGMEELSGFDSQEADEESVANGIQYEVDRHIDIGMAMLSIHLVSGSPEPMQPSDTREVGNLQECHYLEIADFLASSEEDIELQEDLSVTRITDDMLLVRQRVQELKIRVPIDAMEVIQRQFLTQEDNERLLFQGMRYSEEFNSFVLKNPATPNQMLCNYLNWYTTTAVLANQDHASGEELGTS